MSDGKQSQHSVRAVPREILERVFDENRDGIIVWRQGVVCANAAALEQMGYTAREVKTFNYEAFSTGSEKAKLDTLLGFCAERGIHDIVLPMRLKTVDNKELYIDPEMHHESVAGDEYWVARMRSVKKVDPATLRGKAYSWAWHIRRRIRGDAEYLHAPKYVDAPFIENVLRSVAGSLDAKVAVDFRKTVSFSKEAVPWLNDLGGRTWSNQLYMLNAGTDLYHFLRFHQIDKKSIYPPGTLPVILVPA